MVNFKDIRTFNRVESARILGIPPTTLANWNEELGIAPLQGAGTRGVPSMYPEGTLFRAAIAKRQLELGLSKKMARATSDVIYDLLNAAGVLTEGKEMGVLLGTGTNLHYIPRENWDDPQKFQKDISENKTFCWLLDLRPVLDSFLAALRPVIFERLGFELEGPARSGVYRITLLDGTKFEGESFDSVLEQFRDHHNQSAGQSVAAALGRHSRYRSLDPDVVDDMHDLARFVGYEDAQEFSSDIENVRKTLGELAIK